MSTGQEVFVLPGLRSPFCKIDRELSSVDALDLSVPVVQQTVAGERGPGREGARRIDLMVWGSVIPNLGISNWGREVWLETGLAPEVPALTIGQACGTSLAAVTHAAAQIASGHGGLSLCGGVESMSNTQIGLSEGLSRTIRRAAQAGSPTRSIKTLGGLKPSDLKIAIPGVDERTTGKSMGQHTEQMAREWGVARHEQDEYALTSHLRAAREEGRFYRRMLVSPGTFDVDHDTIPRPDTSLDQLAQLPPAFDKRDGTLTAGNSSPLTDGAAACWVASARGRSLLPEELPAARLLDWEQAAVDLEREGLLIGPGIAIARLLARHGLGYSDIQLWEFHEAFAAQVLATLAALETPDWLSERAGVDRDLGAFPRDRINPNGGSVALGHPFAATGARVVSQAVAELGERPTGTRAVVSICAAGGLGHVALLETA